MQRTTRNLIDLSKYDIFWQLSEILDLKYSIIINTVEKYGLSP